MNLPFGLPSIREVNSKKKDDGTEIAAYYEKKLAEYRDTLEKYKTCLFDYAKRLDGYEKRAVDQQLTTVQTALDLTYLKEQGDKLVELTEELKAAAPVNLDIRMESLAGAISDVNSKLDSLDKNVVSRLTELLLELQKQSVYQSRQMNSELIVEVEKLKKTVKMGHTLIWFLFIMSMLSLSGIAFIGLYIMEIIPF